MQPHSNLSNVASHIVDLDNQTNLSNAATFQPL